MEPAIYIIIGLLVYFIPTVVGWRTKNVSGIFILNLFLGWTFLGWVAALIWAVSAPKENKKQNKKRNNFGKINWRDGLTSIKNIFFISSKQYEDEEIVELRVKLNQGEAIIKNKMNNEYSIVTADQWEEILAEGSQEDFEIIEEK